MTAATLLADRPDRPDRAPVRPASPSPDSTATRGADSALLASACRLHRDDLYRFARRRLGDPVLADEAVQETFLRAWRFVHRFDPAAGSMRVWLFGICRNAAADVGRRRAKDARNDRAGGEAAAVGVDELERVLARWQTAEALRAMTPPQRHAVIAVHLHDRPYATVAAELGVPVGTVKSRVHVGLQAARDAVRDHSRVRSSGQQTPDRQATPA